MKDEKAEVYIRVLDDNHRVCIPIQVRQEMEVSPGCSIEFLADHTAEIWTGGVQHLLDGMREVYEFQGKPVCSACWNWMIRFYGPSLQHK